jgi:oligopeptide/dipeptide ABC transporter ATP-binding protein
VRRVLAGRGECVVTLAPPVLESRDVTVEFTLRDRFRRRTRLRAVDHVTLSIGRGETLGLVGESGSGKSTYARALVQVQPVVAGEVLVGGQPLHDVDRATLRRRRRDIQMVFQNPAGSLNPRHTILQSVIEPLVIHRIGDAAERRRRGQELLDQVGLSPLLADRYPHALSGGQQQRVAIARALITEPKLIICDEPVSALDVSVQAQIIKLLQQIQAEFGVALLFIAHDLAVVRHISHRVAVMYLGRIVEQGPVESVYAHPQHPYTRALLSAVPVPNVELERARNRIILKGDPPDPAHPPSGCRFRTRCPWARQRCADETPLLRVAAPGHEAACHYFEEIPSMQESADVTDGVPVLEPDRPPR